jgi:hypothetical protein
MGMFASRPVQNLDRSHSWRAKPGPVPLNPGILMGLAIPVGSNLRFRVSGFTFMVAFTYTTVERKIAPQVRYSLFRMY